MRGDCGVPRVANHCLQLVSISMSFKQRERTWYLPDGVDARLLRPFVDCGIVNSAA